MNNCYQILIILCVFISFIGLNAYAQNISIDGKVQNHSNEILIGASIYDSISKTGCLTDINGNFTLPIKKGNHIIRISYVGYQTRFLSLNLFRDTTLTVILAPEITQHEEVIIKARKNDDNITNIQVGSIEIDMSQMELLPQFVSESDLLKSLQLKSGINTSAEGQSGLMVRGGNIDQNLLLLDNSIIYNPTHLMGFYSVFNSNAISKLTLYKGTIPARYSGRISSVIAVNMKEGNMDSLVVNGSIGLLSSKLTVETPIVKKKHSVIISVRKTYIDELIKPAIKGINNTITDYYDNSFYSFYDVNGKITSKITKKDKLTFSFYKGGDNFKMDKPDKSLQNDLNWSNQAISLQHQHYFNENLFAKTTIGNTRYLFNFNSIFDQYGFSISSNIDDWYGKAEIHHRLHSRLKLIYGAGFVSHNILPGDKGVTKSNSVFDFNDNQTIKSLETQLFCEADYSLTDALKFNIGLNFTHYAQIGPYTYYTLDLADHILDTILYNKGEQLNQYNTLEPRIAINWIINKSTSIKGGYMRNFQFMHLANIASVSLPADFWIPSIKNIKPQYGNQVSIGLYRNFMNHKINTSIETFYKNMHNILEYKFGILGNTYTYNLDQTFLRGQGYAYGTELEISKVYGKITGAVNFCYSRTFRQFVDINNGNPYPAKYDHPIDVSTQCTWSVSDRIKAAAVFIYTSGNNITIPESKYIIQGGIINSYSNKNGFRMPAYHRLDLSLTVKSKPRKKYNTEWIFSVYNAYNRMNPFFVYFEAEGDLDNYELNVKAKQVTLFPILPSIAYKFKF